VNPQHKELSLAPRHILELRQHVEAARLNEYLNQRPEFLQTNVVRQLGEAVRQEVRVNIKRAHQLADAALEIAHKIADAEALGLANRAKANALWFGGQLHSAIELFQVALKQFEGAGAEQEAGRTLSSSIQPLMLLGRYERALEVAEQARGIFRRAGDLWRLARLEINVANIHQRQARSSEALEAYERAYQQLGPYKDQEAMAAALHNMAVCLISLNDFERAIETYRRARNVSAENNMPLVVAQSDYNIAYLYFLRGDYQRAIQGLGATRDLCRKNQLEYHSALCDLDQSEIYLELNLSREAAQLAQRAQKQFEKLGIVLEAGRSLVNLAIALHQQEESAAALDLFQQAREVFAKENNAAWQALIELYRALVLLETGEEQAAVEPSRAALKFFDTEGLSRRAILCHLLLARALHHTGRLGEAQEHSEAALRLLAGIEAPMLAFHAHMIVGDFQRTLGKSRQSYHSYQRAQRNLEALRSRLQGEELKIAFMKNRVDVYEKLVGICLEQKRSAAFERAFRYMEHAKSRSLVELVFGVSRSKPALHQRNPLERRIGVESSERLTKLRQELNWCYRRLDIEQTRPEGISLPQIRELQALARSKEDELIEVIGELRRGHGDAADLKEAAPVKLDDIQAALGDETTLVEYFQIGSRLIAAVLTQRSLEIAPLMDIGDLASSIRMLGFQLSKFEVRGLDSIQSSQSLLAATQSRLRDLYSQLVGPLAGKLSGRRLVVAPHGVLHYLPFHALLDGDTYLIDRFTIAYAPSASMYAICAGLGRRSLLRNAGTSLLLGVPDKRTPWIPQEIRSVAEILPNSKICIGRKAGINALRTTGASSRIIHIATHGVFRRDNPMFSSVRLGDSYLNIYDLYELRLPVELLTLSGCGTGLSVVAAGDELLGLVRGLLSTGAEALLLSLWDVHDRTTAQLMVAFYRGIRNHRDKGEALREAMLELRKTHPHPYYWAPFILVGKSDHSPPDS
jgi:tetratricopeptide (TPR) repeat protein